MRIIASLVAVLLSASTAFSEPGMSYLGICHRKWPCAESLKAFAGLDTIRAGWVMHTFDERCSCAERLLQDPRPKEIRIHLAWIKHSGRNPSYETFSNVDTSEADRQVRTRDPRLLSRFKNVLGTTKSLLQQAKGPLKCWISPVMESALSDEARKILHAEVKAVIPECTPVDAVYGRECLPGYVCEKHGDNPRLRAPCFVDLDGLDFQKVDMPAYIKRFAHCEGTHIWGLKFNGIDHHNPQFVDPRQRTTFPSSTYFQLAGRYLKKGATDLPPLSPVLPRDTKGCRKVFKPKDGAGGFTWKQSDTHPGAVALLPRNLKPRNLNLVKAGRVVARFRYSADFKGDGRPIYRTDKNLGAFPTNAVLRSELGCWVLDYPMHRID